MYTPPDNSRSGSIPFIHSFTRCYATCAIYNKNKLSILKCFLKMPNEKKAIAEIFYDPTTTTDAVAQAGEEMFLTMYQAPPSEILHQGESQSCTPQQQLMQ
ncbi:hypothetical protein PR048_003784 [Dryococelus australis]|uniref:Uncharacterized protein n=1 Tax=Dryococelus australis TaxID=614101 RepID=A0ABQ9INZ6_9NEOP|nr:hypothetical protein PR048_003784 [Dryococelus australis]